MRTLFAFFLLFLTCPAMAADTVVTASPGQGVTVQTRDQSYSFQLWGRMQLRDTLSFDEQTQTVTNTFEVKTVRVRIAGNMFGPRVRYGLQLALAPGDFEKDNASPIFDAFVDVMLVPELRLKLGQYLVPFDRSRTTVEYALELVDRPLVVRELSLDRDIGASLYALPFGGRLRVDAFLGGGAGKNRVSPQGGPLAVLRASARPFGAFDDDSEGDLDRSPKFRLALGAGGGYVHAATRQGSTNGASLPTAIDQTHFAADLVAKWHGIALIAEALVRKPQGPRPNETRAAWGYFVQSSVMVHPRVAVIGRFEQLIPFEPTDPTLREQKQITFGGTVYVNKHRFKVQTDYTIAPVDAVAPKHVWRLQLDCSF